MARTVRQADSIGLWSENDTIRISQDIWLHKRICGECGKTMWIDPTVYAYHHNTRHGIRYYCSYTCWRVLDRKKREREARIAERQMEEAAKYDADGFVLVRKKAGRPKIKEA